jgi:glucose-1-phosphate thymidylyltransferase
VRPVRGVLLAGGTGSRLHPLTRITNKHLLPVYDRPMVHWAIEALVKAGIRDLLLVSGGDHMGDFMRLLGDGHELGLRNLSYAVQAQAGGVAQALGLAESFADGEPVVVMLADNIFERSIRPTVEAFAEDPHGARVLLSEVAEPEHLRHLGVAELDDAGRILRIIEKPSDPPTNLAVTGLYCFDGSVFSVIAGLSPSSRGELEIADVNNHYASSGSLTHELVVGYWADAGESIDAYQAASDFVRDNGANKD